MPNVLHSTSLPTVRGSAWRALWELLLAEDPLAIGEATYGQIGDDGINNTIAAPATMRPPPSPYGARAA